MEESEKRKERLSKMRMQAAEAGDAGNSMGVSGSHSLANPLIEGFSTPNAEPRAAPRFDYYTDPMSAFNANKSSKVSHQYTPDYFTTPRPRNPNLAPNHYSPDPRTFHTQGSYYDGSGLIGSPMGRSSPFGTPRGNINPASPFGSPRGSINPASPFGTPPGNINPQYGCSGPSNYCTPSIAPRGGSLHSPGFQRGGSPSFSYGQGRGYRFNNSPQAGSNMGGSAYPNSGRGRSHWLGNSSHPGSVQSGRRNAGPHNAVSAELRPDLYYRKSMVEDPWKMLKPVIWRRNVPTNSETPDNVKSWLPNSITAKKARVSETLNKYRSEQSLAEYLASSFNEAANEPDDAQQSV